MRNGLIMPMTLSVEKAKAPPRKAPFHVMAYGLAFWLDYMALEG